MSAQPSTFSERSVAKKSAFGRLSLSTSTNVAMMKNTLAKFEAVFRWRVESASQTKPCPNRRTLSAVPGGRA